MPDNAPETDEVETMAADFENREFTPDELANIKWTRRRMPRAAQSADEPDTPDPDGDLAIGLYTRHMSSEDFLDSFQDRP
ncbi:MAG: hypothetical protein OXG34_12840 [bacterium]|nr:hypothetical protein [bacterium]